MSNKVSRHPLVSSNQALRFVSFSFVSSALNLMPHAPLWKLKSAEAVLVCVRAVLAFHDAVNDRQTAFSGFSGIGVGVKSVACCSGEIRTQTLPDCVPGSRPERGTHSLVKLAYHASVVRYSGEIRTEKKVAENQACVSEVVRERRRGGG